MGIRGECAQEYFRLKGVPGRGETREGIFEPKLIGRGVLEVESGGIVGTFP